MIEAIEYQNWLNKGSHDYELCDMGATADIFFDGFIPSGTIQFVKNFLSNYHKVYKISPINIPNDLMWNEYLKRNITFKHKGNYIFEDEKFVKSDTVIKGLTEVTKILNVPDDGRYLVSDLIDIESEWRAFVFNGELVGLQNYLGDFTMMPDVKLIKKMISEYKKSPLAYSLDVGVNEKDGTFLIECHNFFSVGTYGFSNNKYLPQMFIQSFKHLVKNGF